MALRRLASLAFFACVLLVSAGGTASAEPDLQVEIIAIETGPPSKLTVLVHNTGDSTARASKVGIILDAGAARSGVKAPVRRLKAGETLSLVVPVLVVPGVKVQAVIDVENDVDESEEKNNESPIWMVELSGRELVLVPMAPEEPAEDLAEEEEETAPGEEEAEETAEESTEPEPLPETVEIVPGDRPPPLPPLADLVVKVLEVRPGTGGGLSLSVENRGLLATPRTHVLLTLNSGGRRSEVEALVPALEPAHRVVLELPADLPGQARFQVMADARNAVLESDERNNRTALDTVPGEAPAEPVATATDLAVSILRVEPGPPLTVRVRVENLGSLSSTATVVTLALGAGQSLVEEVPPLKPGQSIEVVFRAGSPEELVATVDPNGAIAESDESNNRSEADLPELPQPAPAVPDGEAGRTPWLLGETPVLIEPGILGEQKTIPGSAPGAPERPLAAIVLPDGGRLVFVENQLVFTGSAAEALALAERLGGRITRTIVRPDGLAATYVVTFVPSAQQALPPRGASAVAPLLVSSLDALALLSVVLQEQADGVTLSVDPVLELTDVFTGETPEAQGQNSSAWSYMRAGEPFDVDVAGAWRLLAIAGLPPNRIKLAIIDRGFASEDLPPFTGTTGLYSTSLALESKPFHGALVAAAAAAVAGNGIGAAGPAGAAANLLLLDWTRTLSDTMASVWQAAAQGASIISMSFASPVPRGTDLFYLAWDPAVVQFEADTRYLFEHGILLFAGAGNETLNIDELNADGDESVWLAPCENQGVICVGGWSRNDALRHLLSNYGEGRGETVDIYGPFVVWTPNVLNPAPDTIVETRGTSLATPFVAGVAALVWSANPALSSAEVWELLRSNVTLGRDGIPMVNAYRPARQALLLRGDNFPPHLRLLAPAEGYAAASQAEPLRLAVEAIDIEDGDSCCAIEWASDVDGPLGSGSSIEVPFAGKPTGTRVVTVSVTDSGGLTATAAITVDYSNAAPRLVLLQPANGATLYRGFEYAFRAELHDDTAKLDLPLSDCSAVTWTSSDPKDPNPLATGCTPKVKFAAAGPRTIMVSTIDGYGATASEHVTLSVIEPGSAGSAPIALAITSPTAGSAFNVETRIPLGYQLQDPGAGSKKPNYKIVWKLGRDLNDRRVFTPKKDAKGQYIRILDVFPERKSDGTGAGYTLWLEVSDPARPGSTSETFVPISFLPAVK